MNSRRSLSPTFSPSSQPVFIRLSRRDLAVSRSLPTSYQYETKSKYSKVEPWINNISHDYYQTMDPGRDSLLKDLPVTLFTRYNNSQEYLNHFGDKSPIRTLSPSYFNNLSHNSSRSSQDFESRYRSKMRSNDYSSIQSIDSGLSFKEWNRTLETQSLPSSSRRSSPDFRSSYRSNFFSPRSQSARNSPFRELYIGFRDQSKPTYQSLTSRIFNKYLDSKESKTRSRSFSQPSRRSLPTDQSDDYYMRSISQSSRSGQSWDSSDDEKIPSLRYFGRSTSARPSSRMTKTSDYNSMETSDQSSSSFIGSKIKVDNSLRPYDTDSDLNDSELEEIFSSLKNLETIYDPSKRPKSCDEKFDGYDPKNQINSVYNFNEMMSKLSNSDLDDQQEYSNSDHNEESIFDDVASLRDKPKHNLDQDKKDNSVCENFEKTDDQKLENPYSPLVSTKGIQQMDLIDDSNSNKPSQSSDNLLHLNRMEINLPLNFNKLKLDSSNDLVKSKINLETSVNHQEVVDNLNLDYQSDVKNEKHRSHQNVVNTDNTKEKVNYKYFEQTEVNDDFENNAQSIHDYQQSLLSNFLNVKKENENLNSLKNLNHNLDQIDQYLDICNKHLIEVQRCSDDEDDKNNAKYELEDIDHESVPSDLPDEEKCLNHEQEQVKSDLSHSNDQLKLVSLESNILNSEAQKAINYNLESSQKLDTQKYVEKMDDPKSDGETRACQNAIQNKKESVKEPNKDVCRQMLNQKDDLKKHQDLSNHKANDDLKQENGNDDLNVLFTNSANIVNYHEDLNKSLKNNDQNENNLVVISKENEDHLKEKTCSILKYPNQINQKVNSANIMINHKAVKEVTEETISKNINDNLDSNELIESNSKENVDKIEGSNLDTNLMQTKFQLIEDQYSNKYCSKSETVEAIKNNDSDDLKVEEECVVKKIVNQSIDQKNGQNELSLQSSDIKAKEDKCASKKVVKHHSGVKDDHHRLKDIKMKADTDNNNKSVTKCEQEKLIQVVSEEEEEEEVCVVKLISSQNTNQESNNLNWENQSLPANVTDEIKEDMIIHSPNDKEITLNMFKIKKDDETKPQIIGEQDDQFKVIKDDDKTIRSEIDSIIYEHDEVDSSDLKVKENILELEKDPYDVICQLETNQEGDKPFSNSADFDDNEKSCKVSKVTIFETDQKDGSDDCLEDDVNNKTYNIKATEVEESSFGQKKIEKRSDTKSLQPSWSIESDGEDLSEEKIREQLDKCQKIYENENVLKEKYKSGGYQSLFRVFPSIQEMKEEEKREEEEIKFNYHYWFENYDSDETESDDILTTAQIIDIYSDALVADIFASQMLDQQIDYSPNVQQSPKPQQPQESLLEMFADTLTAEILAAQSLSESLNECEAFKLVNDEDEDEKDTIYTLNQNLVKDDKVKVIDDTNDTKDLHELGKNHKNPGSNMIQITSECLQEDILFDDEFLTSLSDDHECIKLLECEQNLKQKCNDGLKSLKTIDLERNNDDNQSFVANKLETVINDNQTTDNNLNQFKDYNQAKEKASQANEENHQSKFNILDNVNKQNEQIESYQDIDLKQNKSLPDFVDENDAAYQNYLQMKFQDDNSSNDNEKVTDIDIEEDLTRWSKSLLSSDLNEAEINECSEKAEVNLNEVREETNKGITEERKEEAEVDKKANKLSFKTSESVDEKNNSLINYQADSDVNYDLNMKEDKECETTSTVKAEKYNWTEKIKEMKKVNWLPTLSHNANPRINCSALLMIILIIFLITFLIVISNLINYSQASQSTLHSKYLKSCDCLSSQTDQCSQ